LVDHRQQADKCLRAYTVLSDNTWFSTWCNMTKHCIWRIVCIRPHPNPNLILTLTLSHR